jgi:hypothetical protein
MNRNCFKSNVYIFEVKNNSTDSQGNTNNHGGLNTSGGNPSVERLYQHKKKIYDTVIKNSPFLQGG